MHKRPGLGIHEITVGNRKIKIFVAGHIHGKTSAFVFKFKNHNEVNFIPKSHLRFCHLMQFYDEVGSPEEKRPSGWGIMVLNNPLLLHPIQAASWETTGDVKKDD